MEQETLDRINKRLESLEVIHTRYQGPRGPAGKDAPPPRIVIGTVTSGDQADAKIRTADGTFFLDLCYVVAAMDVTDTAISPGRVVVTALMR